MPPVHLTRYQKQHLMKYVLNSLIMRLSVAESANYLKRELGIEYALQTVASLRSQLRRAAKTELDKLRSDHFEFKYQYMQRIKEIEWIIEQRHQLYKEATENKKFYQQDKCLIELKDLSIVLNNFNELIPLIDRYNVANGEFLDDIQVRKPQISNVISEDKPKEEQIDRESAKLPRSERIFDVATRNAFLDRTSSET